MCDTTNSYSSKPVGKPYFQFQTETAV